MDIETAATSEIKSRIALTELLSQFINEGDKEPKWDGFIYAYSDKSKSNDNMIGRAPVQVKGKLLKRLSKNGRTYPVDRNNMISYRNDGGIIYFVVELSNDGSKKIFYASLTPYLLNNYLNLPCSGSNINIRLKSLPEKNNDFENLVTNFIKDCKKQAVLNTTGKNWTVPEIIKLLGPDNIKMNCNFTARGYDVHDPFSILMHNELYLYMENEESGLRFPIQYLSNIESMCTEVEANVYANGKLYYDKISIEKSKDGSDSVKVGPSLKIIFSEEKATFKYDLKGTLDEQIHSIEFLMDMLVDEGIYFDEDKFSMSPTKKELKKFSNQGMEEKLKKFYEIKDFLEQMGVKDSFDVEKATEKQLCDLEIFIKSVLHDEEIFFNETDLPLLGMFEVGNLHLMLLLRQQDNGSYKIKDYFRTEMHCKLDAEGRNDTSQFCIMRASDYEKASNIGISLIEKSFKEHYNKAHYERTNLCLLEMIKAYDNTRRTELITLAQNLCEWLIQSDEPSPIYTLNLFQCVLRTRELRDEEIKDLSNLTQDENTQIRLGANILLGNHRMARVEYNSLSDEDREAFQQYPIFKFYETDNNEGKVAP